jgi:hypothetical protein
LSQDDGGSEILCGLHQASRISGDELEYLLRLTVDQLQALDAAAESADLGEISWRAFDIVKSELLRSRTKIDDDLYRSRLEVLGLDGDTLRSDHAALRGTARYEIDPGWEWGLLSAGALLLVASFLPWFHGQVANLSGNSNGMQLAGSGGFSWNGLATLLVGAEAIVIALVTLSHTRIPSWLRGSPGLLGLVALLAALNGEARASDAAHLIDSFKVKSLSASVGYGVWLALAASTLVVIAAVVPWVQAQSAARTFSSGAFRPTASSTDEASVLVSESRFPRSPAGGLSRGPGPDQRYGAGTVPRASSTLPARRRLTLSFESAATVDASPESVMAWWFHPDRRDDLRRRIEGAGARDFSLTESTTDGLRVRTMQWTDRGGWETRHEAETRLMGIDHLA